MKRGRRAPWRPLPLDLPISSACGSSGRVLRLCRLVFCCAGGGGARGGRGGGPPPQVLGRSLGKKERGEKVAMIEKELLLPLGKYRLVGQCKRGRKIEGENKTHRGVDVAVHCENIININIRKKILLPRHVPQPGPSREFFTFLSFYTWNAILLRTLKREKGA